MPREAKRDWFCTHTSSSRSVVGTMSSTRCSRQIPSTESASCGSVHFGTLQVLSARKDSGAEGPESMVPTQPAPSRCFRDSRKQFARPIRRPPDEIRMLCCSTFLCLMTDLGSHLSSPSCSVSSSSIFARSLITSGNLDHLFVGRREGRNLILGTIDLFDRQGVKIAVETFAIIQVELILMPIAADDIARKNLTYVQEIQTSVGAKPLNLKDPVAASY